MNADNIIDASAHATKNAECFENLKQLGLVEEDLEDIDWVSVKQAVEKSVVERTKVRV